MALKSYLHHTDCVWLALDRAGRVGVFVTAGVGPIPKKYLNEKEIDIEEIEATLCELPSIAKVKLIVNYKRPDSFIEIAEKGFCVYDWRDIHRIEAECSNLYELVAIPDNLIHVDQLPHVLFNLVKNLPSVQSNFGDDKLVSVINDIECVTVPSTN